MNPILEVIEYVFAFLVILVGVYVVARIITAAYFNSKEKFVRRLTDGDKEEV